MKIKAVYDFLDSVAPYKTQCPWDNSGLMAGTLEGEVNSLLLCIDCTDDVIEQAVANNMKLIICHHPLIFNPVKSVEENTPLYNAIKHGITVISAHTNLDMAQGGVNDALCERLEIKNVQPLVSEEVPIMRMGTTDFETVKDFAEFCAKNLDNSVKFSDSGKKVSKVAVCGGAGGEYIYDAFSAGCDTFVTGEAKHHEYLEAKRLGINLLVAGHFSTEVPVLQALCDKLLKEFPEHTIGIAHEEAPYETVVINGFRRHISTSFVGRN